MKYRLLWGVGVFAATVQLASAQSFAYFDSQNTFTVAKDSSVTLVQDPNNASGPYQNFTAATSGDGVINGNFTNEAFDFATGGYVYATCGSSSALLGMATQFQGENYNMVFDNTSGVTQTISIGLSVVQHLSAGGYSKADAYAGIQEYANNVLTDAYFTNTLHGNGNFASNYYGGFTGGYNNINLDYEGSDTYTFTLVAGETAQMQIWASGDTFAQSPNPTPEPITMGLGIAGIGLAVRRRMKAKAQAAK